MGGRRVYNHETFPSGTRVRVHAAQPMEGTDHEWHGHVGTLVSNGAWTLVRMDRGVARWPSRDVLICNHNLRRV